jgi:hypothetical protein
LVTERIRSGETVPQLDSQIGEATSDAYTDPASVIARGAIHHRSCKPRGINADFEAVLHGIQEVDGSIPFSSTIYFPSPFSHSVIRSSPASR